MKNTNAQTPESLLHDLRNLVTEAEKMMISGGVDQDEEGFVGLRQRFDAAQERFSEAYAGARKKVVAGAKYTDDTIRANPYQSLAIALGIGVLLGVVVGRRGQ